VTEVNEPSPDHLLDDLQESALDLSPLQELQERVAVFVDTVRDAFVDTFRDAFLDAFRDAFVDTLRDALGPCRAGRAPAAADCGMPGRTQPRRSRSALPAEAGQAKYPPFRSFRIWPTRSASPAELANLCR
jgi:hypothetical protein